MSDPAEKIRKIKTKCKTNPTNPEANNEAKTLMDELGIQLDGNTEYSLQKKRFKLDKNDIHIDTGVFCLTSNQPYDQNRVNTENAIFTDKQEEMKTKNPNAWMAHKDGLKLTKTSDDKWGWCSTSPNVIKETVDHIKNAQLNTKNSLSQSCDFLTGIPKRMTELNPNLSSVKIPPPMPESKPITKEEMESSKPQVASTGILLTGIIPDRSTEIFIPTEGLSHNDAQKLENAMNNDEFKSKKEKKITWIEEQYNKDTREYDKIVHRLLEPCRRNGKEGLCAGVGLTENVVGMFKDNGIIVNVNDLRQEPNPHPFKLVGIKELYDYQGEMVEKARKKKSGIVDVATGGGKTVIASQIIADLGQDTLFIVPNNTLFYNAKTQLGQYIDPKDANIGQIGGMNIDYKNDPNKTDINVVSLPLAAMAVSHTGSDRIDPEKQKVVLQAMKDANVIIFDEAHHIPANTYQKVAKYSPAKYRFGLTATPIRSNNDELEIVAGVGNIIGSIKAKELIAKGKLTPPEIYIINNRDIVPKSENELIRNLKDPDCKLSDFMIKWFDAAGDRLPSAHNEESVYRHHFIKKGSVECNIPRNDRILDVVKNLNKYDKTSVVFVSSVEHGNKLQKLFEDQGIYSEILTGETEGDIVLSEKESENQMTRLKKRNALFDRMKKGDLKTIIATTNIMGEGVDIPAIDALVLANMQSSKVMAIQSVGRAMRLKKGKTKALIFDFDDPIDYLHDWEVIRENTWREEEYPIFHKQYNEIENTLQGSLGNPTINLEDRKKQDKKFIDAKNRQKSLNELDVKSLKTLAKEKGIAITGLGKRELIGKLME